MKEIYLSDKENAARFKVSRATVWRWVATRAFPPPIKFSSGTTRWRLADIEQWEKKMRATGTPPPKGQGEHHGL